jgi:hypothetical protein
MMKTSAFVAVALVGWTVGVLVGSCFAPSCPPGEMRIICPRSVLESRDEPLAVINVPLGCDYYGKNNLLIFEEKSESGGDDGD